MRALVVCSVVLALGCGGLRTNFDGGSPGGGSAGGGSVSAGGGVSSAGGGSAGGGSTSGGGAAGGGGAGGSAGGGSAGGGAAGGGWVTLPTTSGDAGVTFSGFETLKTAPLTDERFFAVVARSATDVWHTSSYGEVVHYDGTNFRLVYRPPSSQRFENLELAGADGLVVRSNTEVALCLSGCRSQDAGVWVSRSVSHPLQFAGLCSSTSGVWVVGGDVTDSQNTVGLVWKLERDGGLGAPVSTTTGTLQDCVELPDGTLVAAGARGVVRRAPSGTLTTSRPPGFNPLIPNLDLWSAVARIDGRVFVAGFDKRLAGELPDGGWELLVSRPQGSSGRSWHELLRAPAGGVELYGHRGAGTEGPRGHWSPGGTTLWPDPANLDIYGVAETTGGTVFLVGDLQQGASTKGVLIRATRR